MLLPPSNLLKPALPASQKKRNNLLQSAASSMTTSAEPLAATASRAAPRCAGSATVMDTVVSDLMALTMNDPIAITAASVKSSTARQPTACNANLLSKHIMSIKLLVIALLLVFFAGLPVCHACSCGAYGMLGWCGLCNSGEVSNGDGARAYSCLRTPAGRWTQRGLPPDQLCITPMQAPICDAGRYGTGGSTDSQCDGACFGGFWCPAATQLPTGAPAGGACSAGYYCPEGSSADKQNVCPVGQFCVIGSASGVPCPAGRFCGQGSESALGTDPCKAGFYCPQGSLVASAMVCPAGYFCPAGSASGTEYPCPSGRFCEQGSESALGTDPCKAGFYCPQGSNTSQPFDCGVGTYCPAGSSAPVADLRPGEYTIGDTSSTRTQKFSCAPGHACAGDGDMLPCPVHWFQSGIGQTHCVICPAGRSASTNGSQSCSPCPAGSTSEAGHPCVTCDAGSVSVDGASCLRCAAGTLEKSRLLCESCPENFYLPLLAPECVSCLNEPGLYCTHGQASVQAGFWPSLSDAVDANYSVIHATACPPATCLASSALSMAFGNTSASNGVELFAADFCLWPRVNSVTNTLCGSCVDGYIPWLLTAGSCARCTGWNHTLVYLALLLSVITVAFFLLTTGADPALSGAIAVLSFFLQTSALLIGNSSTLTSWLHVCLVPTLAGSGSTSGDCLGPIGPQQQTLLVLMAPVWLLGLLGLVALVHCWLHGRRLGGASEGLDPILQSPDPVDSFRDRSNRLARLKAWMRFPSFDHHRYISASISLLLFCYTSVARSCMNYLYCVSVGEERRLFLAPSIDCSAAAYRSYLPVVYLFLAVYVTGLPVVIACVLMRFGRQFRADAEALARIQLTADTTSMDADHVSADDWTSKCALQSPRASVMRPPLVRLRFSELYIMFAPHACTFGLALVLLRRAALVVVTVFLAQDDRAPLRFFCFGLLAFLQLTMHLALRPYAQSMVHLAETISAVILCFLPLLLIAFWPAADHNLPAAVQVIALLLILIPTLIYVVYILSVCARGRRTPRFSMATTKRHSGAADLGKAGSGGDPHSHGSYVQLSDR